LEETALVTPTLLSLALSGCGLSLVCGSDEGCGLQGTLTLESSDRPDWEEDFSDPEAAAAELGLELLSGELSMPGLWTGVLPLDEGHGVGLWLIESCEAGELALELPRPGAWCGAESGTLAVDGWLLADSEHAGSRVRVEVPDAGGFEQQVSPAGEETGIPVDLEVLPDCAEDPRLRLTVTPSAGCRASGGLIWALSYVALDLED